jgi:hypothetical protein
MNTNEFVEDLNSRFFNGELSPLFKEELQKLPIDRPDVFAFVERTFGFIQQAGLPATDMSVMLGEILGSLLARLLPGAWEGRVPPITVPGRHAEIDEYIKKNPWISAGSKNMLDIGCGFPPYTTLDTANYFPDWQIIGADPSLPMYLVHDAEGNYATLDNNKSTIYFQPSIPTIENWNGLLKDSGATKRRFEELLNTLLETTPKQEGGLPKLEINPIMSYETDSLNFINGGIGQITIEPQNVIRCFNVLIYFDDDFFQKTLNWFAENLKEKGILIIGANWAVSTENYYNVFQKEGDILVNREFAFSLDNINPFSVVTWYANHDDDRQTAELIKYLGILRKDKTFMEEYYAISDAQRKKYKICPRDEQGYYGKVDPSIAPAEIWTLVRKMLDELNEAGMNEKAAEVLRRSGLKARVNEVGHIAIAT